MFYFLRNLLAVVGLVVIIATAYAMVKFQPVLTSVGGFEDKAVEFFEDMGERPEGRTLERINNNKGYSPANCRWATMREQLNNQRRNRRITFNGKTQTLSYWADELGIRADTLHHRLRRLPLERALSPGSIRPPWKHGTRHAYETGCRCQICKETHNARMRELRRKRKEGTVR